MLEIYKYTEAHEFLKDAWAAKKKKNKSFSLRSWASQLGFANNSPLSLMLAGKRDIPKKYVPAFIKSLDLSPDEGLFLETLIEMGRAKSLGQKSFYEARLRALSPSTPILFQELESFRCLGNPLHALILEMTDLRNFKPEVAWIQKRLRLKSNLSEIESAVERLISLGLMTEDENGIWKKAKKNITNRPDIADLGSQEYHRHISQLAAEQIALQSVLEREFNGYAINIKKADLPKAKKLIREFILDFAGKIEASSGTGEETYQFNIQFFGLTKLSL